MKLLRLLIIFGLVVSLLLFAYPASAAPSGKGPQFSPDTILVKFQDGTDETTQGQIHARHGGKVISEIPEINVEVVRVPPGQALNKATEYRSEKSVKYAEPDIIAQAFFTPNDPYFKGGFQWDMNRIQAPGRPAANRLR